MTSRRQPRYNLVMGGLLLILLAKCFALVVLSSAVVFGGPCLIFLIIQTINRRDDPRHGKPPLDLEIIGARADAPRACHSVTILSERLPRARQIGAL